MKKEISQTKFKIVDYSHSQREVAAKPIEMEFGFQAIAVQGDAQAQKWGIYETKSGLLIEQGATKKETIEKANNTIKEVGKDKFAKQISNYGDLSTFTKKIKDATIKQQAEIRTYNKAKEKNQSVPTDQPIKTITGITKDFNKINKEIKPSEASPKSLVEKIKTFVDSRERKETMLQKFDKQKTSEKSAGFEMDM